MQGAALRVICQGGRRGPSDHDADGFIRRGGGQSQRADIIGAPVQGQRAFPGNHRIGGIDIAIQHQGLFSRLDQVRAVTVHGKIAVEHGVVQIVRKFDIQRTVPGGIHHQVARAAGAGGKMPDDGLVRIGRRHVKIQGEVCVHNHLRIGIKGRNFRHRGTVHGRNVNLVRSAGNDDAAAFHPLDAESQAFQRGIERKVLVEPRHQVAGRQAGDRSVGQQNAYGFQFAHGDQDIRINVHVQREVGSVPAEGNGARGRVIELEQALLVPGSGIRGIVRTHMQGIIPRQRQISRQAGNGRSRRGGIDAAHLVPGQAAQVNIPGIGLRIHGYAAGSGVGSCMLQPSLGNGDVVGNRLVVHVQNGTAVNGNIPGPQGTGAQRLHRAAVQGGSSLVIVSGVQFQDRGPAGPVHDQSSCPGNLPDPGACALSIAQLNRAAGNGERPRSGIVLRQHQRSGSGLFHPGVQGAFRSYGGVHQNEVIGVGEFEQACSAVSL